MSTAHNEILYALYQSYDLAELEQLFCDAQTHEEADFYSSLLTKALQKKQLEVLNSDQ